MYDLQFLRLILRFILRLIILLSLVHASNTNITPKIRTTIEIATTSTTTLTNTTFIANSTSTSTQNTASIAIYNATSLSTESYILTLTPLSILNELLVVTEISRRIDLSFHQSVHSAFLISFLLLVLILILLIVHIDHLQMTGFLLTVSPLPMQFIQTAEVSSIIGLTLLIRSFILLTGCIFRATATAASHYPIYKVSSPFYSPFFLFFFLHFLNHY